MSSNLIFMITSLITSLPEYLSPGLLEYLAQQQARNVQPHEPVVLQPARIKPLDHEVTHLKKLNTRHNLNLKAFRDELLWVLDDPLTPRQ
ncbi:hypothetical protein [Endozoicomonas sp. ONNA2]|uniref:hypothetical protein n=1 Tax=Endozoicomonas sp. ONNA2 TaxID=2828741 RepID=UPI002149258C|nr:hypothetical protein [Endozoicomonas sp. ONNA2]